MPSNRQIEDWFKQWYESKKNKDSAYVLRVARAHARYPHAVLSQLRGHALEKQKRISNFRERVRRILSPELLTSRERERSEKIFNVLRSLRKEEKSLTRAAHDEKISRETVLRQLGKSLKKTPRGWQAKKTDDLVRDLYFPNQSGHVVIKGFPVSSDIGAYWNGIRRFVVQGDDALLKTFGNKTFKDIYGNRHAFITDPKILNRLARAGELRFETLYRFEE